MESVHWPGIWFMGSRDDDGRRRRPGRCDMDTMFVGRAAEEVGRLLEREVTPREVTALFYSRAVPEHLGPIVGGRRVIRADAVERIASALRERDARRLHKEEGGGH